MKENIAQRIKQLRLDNNLTQAQFGCTLSVSQDTISLWEKGKSLPTAEYLIAISKTFGVSVDYILCLAEF
jgi:transcriptional regulator with XRE-family HTH domain